MVAAATHQPRSDLPRTSSPSYFTPFIARPPQELTADQLAQTGQRLMILSSLAFVVLTAGLLGGWETIVHWFLGRHAGQDPSPAWLNLGYFVPIAVPLVLYLAIARWAGDQLFGLA